MRANVCGAADLARHAGGTKAAQVEAIAADDNKTLSALLFNRFAVEARHLLGCVGRALLLPLHSHSG